MNYRLPAEHNRLITGRSACAGCPASCPPELVQSLPAGRPSNASPTGQQSDRVIGGRRPVSQSIADNSQPAPPAWPHMHTHISKQISPGVRFDLQPVSRAQDSSYGHLLKIRSEFALLCLVAIVHCPLSLAIPPWLLRPRLPRQLLHPLVTQPASQSSNLSCLRFSRRLLRPLDRTDRRSYQLFI